MCVNDYLNEFKIVGYRKAAAENAGCWCERVKNAAETFMAHWLEKEKAWVDVRHAKEAASKAQSLACYSAVPPGVAKSQAIAFRRGLNAPPWVIEVLTPCPKRQYQGLDARAKERSENRTVILSKPTAREEARAEERARVTQDQAAQV